MEALLQNIQASRNKAMPTLYLGDLMMNTDQYFMPNDLHNQSNVPAPPPKIFRNYGATAEVDRREFAMVQPQVPRNPEQEALNEYFSRERVKQFATGQSGFLVQEQLSKQAELLANQLVRDEVDRRAGIRRAVLEATGLTPAQIQTQMASEGLAGINPRLIDIRERQVQDAVNLYYNQNNIPVPVTTPFEPSTNIAPTVPAEARVGLPMNEAEAGFIEDQALLKNPEDADIPESTTVVTEPMFPSTTTTTTDPRDRSYAGSILNPYDMNMQVPPHIQEVANAMYTPQLIQYIKDNDIQDPRLFISQGANKGELKSDDTLTRKVGRSVLVDIVAEHMNNVNRPANNNMNSLQKY
jgi:hypothetical protein